MSDKPQDSQSNSRKSPLLYLSFIAVVFGIFTATYWIGNGLAEQPFGLPPIPAFLGVLLAVVALVIGAYFMSKRETSEAREAGESRWKKTRIYHFLVRNGRSLSFFFSISMMLFILWQLPKRSALDNYTGLFLLWLLSTALYLVAVTPSFSVSFDVDAWWQRNRRLIWILTALFVGAFVLRVWQVGSLPFTLSGDEASQGLESIRILEGELRNPFTTGWLGVPTMSFFFNSWSIALFGRTIFGLRIVWVLVGSLTVLAVFFLVKRLMGMRLAVLTAVILTVYHYHIHYSRLGSNQIADPFFLALALLFLYRALDGKNNLDWALTGVITAVALYFYAGARLTPVIIIVVLGYLFVREPKQFFKQHGKGILIATGAFILVASPMLQYGWRFPDDFNARVNEVGILQSGWLDREMEIQGTGPVPILLDQFRRAMLAFNFSQDRTVWYGLREPLLAPFWGVLFVVGMGYGMVRMFGRGSNSRYAPMVAWWWGGMLLGGFLTESPPSSQRLITVVVPVSFFLAVAIWQLVRLGLTVFGREPYPKWLVNGLLTVFLLFFAVYSFRLYFVDYLPQRIYGGPNAEMATMIAPTLHDMRFTHDFYFVGAPHMYWGFSTLPYLVPDAHSYDVIDPIVSEETVGAIPIFSLDKGAVFIFHGLRAPSQIYVEAVYPEGVRHDIYSPVDGNLKATLYVLPPGFKQ